MDQECEAKRRGEKKPFYQFAAINHFNWSKQRLIQNTNKFSMVLDERYYSEVHNKDAKKIAISSFFVFFFEITTQ